MGFSNEADLFERFKTCDLCNGTNTTEIACRQDEESYRYMYFGWCRDCRDQYSYSLNVQTVWDNKGRI